MNNLGTFCLVFILGFFIGGLILVIFHKIKTKGFQTLAKNLLSQAEEEAELLKKNALLTIKQKQIDNSKEFENILQQERKKFLKEEERLKQREDKLETRMNLVEKKLSDIEKREAILISRRTQVEEERKSINELQTSLMNELEKIAALKATDAKELLLNKIQTEIKTETARFIRRSWEEAEKQADNQATKIIATAINRLGSSTASELTVTTVSLPNEEMKGRIIGREGRNIRALEKATGVNFLLDDTPLTVVISGFDPIRKQIAKNALVELVADGRIHLTRIEETVEKATKNIQKQIWQFGEDAALRSGALNLHPELIILLGKLKFRYSLGQNVLDHSLEVMNLMGLMAAELNLDIALAKRIGLLHDIGKAVSHEIEGTHAIIGHNLALKYNESKLVANGIGCHHREMESITLESLLCSTADALSASLPGERIEAVGEYVKRLKKLEELAFSFPGVEKAYALQAGREVHVIVSPEKISDENLIHLTRDLTKKIENELAYPGKIKVTAIREKRVIAYAI